MEPLEGQLFIYTYVVLDMVPVSDDDDEEEEEDDDDDDAADSNDDVEKRWA